MATEAVADPRHDPTHLLAIIHAGHTMPGRLRVFQAVRMMAGHGQSGHGFPDVTVPAHAVAGLERTGLSLAATEDDAQVEHAAFMSGRAVE